MIVIVDYGAGNLRSVAKAVERVGYSATITARPDDIERASSLILPGVGAAADTMRNLRERALVEPIRRAIRAGKPFLGVCMGLQALLTRSEEGGGQECLDVVPGTVRRLPADLTVPHMGWNQVRQRSPHPVFEGVDDEAEFYFVHSFFCDPVDPGVIAGDTEYGITFATVLARDNLVATQFHPEKSGDNGLRIYANFLRWAGEKPAV